MIRRLISLGLFSGAMFVSGGISSSKHWFFSFSTLHREVLKKSLQNKPRCVWGVLMRPGKAFLDFIAEEACLP